MVNDRSIETRFSARRVQETTSWKAKNRSRPLKQARQHDLYSVRPNTGWGTKTIENNWFSLSYAARNEPLRRQKMWPARYAAAGKIAPNKKAKVSLRCTWLVHRLAQFPAKIVRPSMPIFRPDLELELGLDVDPSGNYSACFTCQFYLPTFLLSNNLNQLNLNQFSCKNWLWIKHWIANCYWILNVQFLNF